MAVKMQRIAPAVLTKLGYTKNFCHSFRHFSSDRPSNNGHADWGKKTGNYNGRHQRPIFVAATRQHVGKTSVSLALISGLQKRFGKVGFIKPVGQQHVPVYSREAQNEVRVDKDVVLMREHFRLDHLDYQYMSPVIIPRGYTKDYIDGKIEHTYQLEQVRKAFNHCNAASDVLLCEGTGHCAVGSVVGVNNARVASLMGADMVLVANGGLGSAFDELELNRVLCHHHNVRLAGVILNKVKPDKLEQTKDYMARAMMKAWGVPLLGCVPDRPFLGCAALADLERLFKSELICGHQHKMMHYSAQDMNLVTTSLCRFLENMRDKPSRTLYFCHTTRNDVILGFLGEHQRRKHTGEAFEAALVVCGRKEKYMLAPEVLDMMNGLDVPILLVPYSTRDAMEMIHNYTPKLNINDLSRVKKAVEHYEPHIDFTELLRRTSSSNSSFDEPEHIQRY